MTVKGFCVGRLVDGQYQVWMPIEPEDILYTLDDREFESGREALRDAALAARDDEINEAQGETLDWRN